MRQLIRSNTFIITILTFVVILVFCCMSAHCQSTTVSATVVDQAGTTWANGTYQLDFVPNPNYSINNVQWNGNPFPTSQWHHAGNLNGSGAFSVSGIPSNNFITPSGSTYTLSVCPNATSSCSVISSLTIQGTSIDFSSTVTASTSAPSVKPLPLARAYNDAEVTINPSLVGYFYMRVTDNQPRYWGQDAAWHNFVTGVVSFTAGTLPPLFTTTTGGDPSNPALAFTLDTAAPNTVFANCTTSTAPPSYCSLTPAMIPALPYIPSSTTIFYQTIDANGTAQTQRPSLNFSGEFAETDSSSPARTNIALATTGVAAGSYNCVNATVNAKGQVTAISSTSCLPAGYPTHFQHGNNNIGCSITSPSSFDTCTVAITWPSAFPDNGYQVSCTGINPFDTGNGTPARAVLNGVAAGDKTASGVTLLVSSQGTSSGNVGFSGVDCIAVEN